MQVEHAQLSGSELTVVADGQLLRATYIAIEQRAFLLRAGRCTELAARPLFVASAEDAAALGAVRSPLPGRILTVFVEPGQRVQKGEPLISLEAMKMEHTLRASADGVVLSLSVRAQEQVLEGSTLLVLHDPDAADDPRGSVRERREE